MYSRCQTFDRFCSFLDYFFYSPRLVFWCSKLLRKRINSFRGHAACIVNSRVAGEDRVHDLPEKEVATRPEIPSSLVFKWLNQVGEVALICATTFLPKLIDAEDKVKKLKDKAETKEYSHKLLNDFQGLFPVVKLAAQVKALESMEIAQQDKAGKDCPVK